MKGMLFQLIPAVSLGYMREGLASGGIGLYIFAMQFLIIILSCAAFLIIIIVNTSSFHRRHCSEMRLTRRYQIDENIRTGKYVIPVALNELFVKVVEL
ncbi:hypothetical protein COOONC_26301 [Cooperia oncophora]